jgi:DNA-binding transcriptional LysR family regulator
MIDWNNYLYFMELARTGSLEAAGKRLRVNRTTVARHIANLEAQVGGRLFHRTTKGYELTEIGTSALACAERIEDSFFEFEQSVLASPQKLSGKVRIGATEGFGGSFIAPNLLELNRRYPDLEIELLALPGFVDIWKRQADMSITLEPPTYGRLVIGKLTDYFLRLYASKDYLSNHPRITSTKDLLDHCLIGYIEDLRFSKQLFYLTDTIPSAHPRVTSTSIAAQCKIAAAGTGLAILPNFMARKEPDLQVVLPDVINIKRTFWIVIPSELRDLPRIKTVKDFLKELVNKNQDLLL